MNISNAKILILCSPKHNFSTNTNQGLLEKWLIQGSGKEKCKEEPRMSCCTRKKQRMMGLCQVIKMFEDGAICQTGPTSQTGN